MAGLDPAIHVLLCHVPGKKGVDARDKRGHDGGESEAVSEEHKREFFRCKPKRALAFARGAG